MLTAFDTDGAGRRIEASLTCIATAHALRSHFKFVHAPITALEHGASPSFVNALLNLQTIFPTVAVRAIRAHTAIVAPPHQQAARPNPLPWGVCDAKQKHKNYVCHVRCRQLV